MMVKHNINDLIARAERLEEITLQMSHTRAALMFLGSLVFVAGGFYMLADLDSPHSGASHYRESPLYLLLGGSAAILFFGLCAVVYFARCVTPRAGRLRLTPEILEMPALRAPRRLPWTSVENLRIERVNVNGFGHSATTIAFEITHDPALSGFQQTVSGILYTLGKLCGMPDSMKKNTGGVAPTHYGFSPEDMLRLLETYQAAALARAGAKNG